MKKVKSLFLFILELTLSADCPDRTILCPNSKKCINETLKCNNVNDCEDGFDEKYCRDPHQDETWNLIYQKRPDADRHEERSVCSLSHVPAACVCKEWTKIYCTDVALTDWPQTLPSKTTFLDLSGNLISTISSSSMNSLTDLKNIGILLLLCSVFSSMLMQNMIHTINKDAFPLQNQIRKIYLQNNFIRYIHPEAFCYNNSITQLWLSHNRLRKLTENMFQRLTSLLALYLDSNQIVAIDDKTFENNGRLVSLFLNANRLTRITRRIFSEMRNLTDLNLSWNRIRFIEDGSFAALTKLRSLTLSSNDLGHINRMLFDGLVELKYLDLRGNNIEALHQDAFQSLTSLKSLELTGNSIKTLARQTLERLSSLEYVYFDEFYMCAFAPQVKRCDPLSDGISSHENLLENTVLRVSVWIVGILACCGNVVVLLGRLLLREDNQIHSFYIRNLSLADMLMGIYLLIIGTRDIMFRGKYIEYDDSWRNSWQCDMCGIISTLSSEVSVLTIGLITFDRYISIMYPFYHKKKNIYVAYFIMVTIWGACFTMAVIPIVGLKYFGNTFYRDNAVCIPLQLHRPWTKGWQYSSFLFLGLNSSAFIFTCYAYIVMFIAIKKSTTVLRSTNKYQNTIFIKRFFLIVVTDFVCWVPVIGIKIAALTGVMFSGNLYAWLIVFILPVNSAINPLLYTLTTRLYRRKLLPSFSLYLRRKKSEKSSSSTPARPIHIYRCCSYFGPNNGVRSCSKPSLDDQIKADNGPYNEIHSCHTRFEKNPIRIVNFRRLKIKDESPDSQSMQHTSRNSGSRHTGRTSLSTNI
ncbi:hypothetical protein ScPMuIL_012471 [Solemya velum]